MPTFFFDLLVYGPAYVFRWTTIHNILFLQFNSLQRAFISMFNLALALPRAFFTDFEFFFIFRIVNLNLYSIHLLICLM